LEFWNFELSLRRKYFLKFKDVKIMPTVFKFFGMQFYFWSNEHEPIHIHVKKGRCLAKFVIEPDIELVENKDVILTNWKTYFNQQISS
jgi:hypothetical protein